MRVLIFSLAYHPVVGGAEIAVKEIADRIGDIEFDMVTLRFSKDHPRVEKIGNINVYRIGGGLGYLSKILFIPQSAIWAARNWKKKQYDLMWLVMTYMLFPIIFSRWLGNKLPYVLTLQDGDPFEEVFERRRIKIFKPFLMYGFRNASKVQAISKFLGGWAKDLGFEGKLEIIPNGVDFQLFNQVPNPIRLQELSERLDKKEEEVFLITTSRLVKKNGIDELVRSLLGLPSNVKLLIVGIGPEREKLEKLANDLGLTDRVMFLGHVAYKDIPLYLHISDIFVRPSVSEGFGNSFIEAMAAGLPVIATPVGGITDFLFDPDKNPDKISTGLFAEVGHPGTIAEQVSRLMENPELGDVLVKNSQRMVKEKYEWNLVAKDMKERMFNIGKDEVFS